MSLVLGKGVVEWIAQRTGEFNGFGTDIGIGWMRDGVIVAGVAYANWNGVNIECHIASDGSKRWATRKYLWTIFDYPFNQLKVKRVTVCVGEGNTDSRNLVERLGFEHEATLDSAHPSGDLLIFRLLRGNYRWTSQEYSQRYALAA